MIIKDYDTPLYEHSFGNLNVIFDNVIDMATVNVNEPESAGEVVLSEFG